MRYSLYPVYISRCAGVGAVTLKGKYTVSARKVSFITLYNAVEYAQCCKCHQNVLSQSGSEMVAYMYMHTAAAFIQLPYMLHHTQYMLSIDKVRKLLIASFCRGRSLHRPPPFYPTVVVTSLVGSARRLAQRWPGAGPALARRWPSAGPALAKRWPGAGPALARRWPGAGPALARRWPGAGPALARRWPGAGPALARRWPGAGPAAGPALARRLAQRC